MKRSLLLAITVVLMSVAGRAQFASQVTFQHYFTKSDVDSILHAIGVPGGILTPAYDVKTYKVIYNTVGVDSLPTTASGLLVVPQGAPCHVPILSYEHNNLTRKSDAPSRYHYEWFVAMASGSLGMIALMPDGLGMGDGPGLHPFLHRQSEATSVIDMIRAVKEIVDTTGAMNNDQLFLAGYSEGANAAVAAHEYIQKYLDTEMHVTATGAISGYYDMSGAMVDNMILSDSAVTDPSYLPGLFESYNHVYHYAAHDSDIFVHPYDSLVPVLYNGSKEIYQIDPSLPSVAHNVLQQSVLDSIRNDTTNYFRQLLKKNDAYNWSPNSHITMFFCNADEVVPYQHTINAYQHFLANGSTTVDTLNAGATDNHNVCGQFSTLAAIAIIRQYRFQPMILTTSSTRASSASATDGTATAHDTLGEMPYHYLWSNGDSTATISNLAPGTYYVTITDKSFCTISDSVVVDFSNGINDITLSNINVYPNPTRDILTIENKNNEKLSLIELLDMNGNAVNATQVIEANAIKMNIGLEAKGIYTLHIRSASGRELHRKIVLL